MKLRIKKLDPSAILPTRAHPTDSGLDLCACLPDGSVRLDPGDSQMFFTGIAIELKEPFILDAPFLGGPLPLGFEAQVRPRSGLARKGIIACGGIGTVDNGYRGDIGVNLYNTSQDAFIVRHGTRIAQLVIAPVVYPDIEEVTELSETERGTSGFGSTGV